MQIIRFTVELLIAVCTYSVPRAWTRKQNLSFFLSLSLDVRTLQLVFVRVRAIRSTMNNFTKVDGSSRTDLLGSYVRSPRIFRSIPSFRLDGMMMWIHGIYEYYTKIDLWNMIMLSHHNSTLASSHSYPITIVNSSFFVLLVWATLSVCVGDVICVCSFPCGWNGSQRHVCVCAWCVNKKHTHTHKKTKKKTKT